VNGNQEILRLLQEEVTILREQLALEKKREGFGVVNL